MSKLLHFNVYLVREISKKIRKLEQQTFLTIYVEEPYIENLILGQKGLIAVHLGLEYIIVLLEIRGQEEETEVLLLYRHRIRRLVIKQHNVIQKHE